jgi:hypothetical protein
MLTLFLACQSAEKPSCAEDEFAFEGSCYAEQGLLFDGISKASWDAAAGLVADWEPAEEAVEPVSYQVTVWNSAGEVEKEWLEDAAPGDGLLELPNDRYRLRVVAMDGAGRTGGWDKVLTVQVGENRLVYLGEYAVNGGARSLSGKDSLVALGGGGASNHTGEVTLVDTTDPAHIQLLSTITGLGQVSDVEVHEDLLFVATDTTLDPEETVAVGIYDISDLTSPRLLSTIGPEKDDAHTISWGGDFLFLASTARAREAIWSFEDPTSPELVGAWTPPPSTQAGTVHDQLWQDGLLYAAYTHGFGIVDASNPASPEVLATVEADWSDPFVHNLAVTEDGRTMAMSEEAVGGGLRLYDISELESPVLVGSFVTEETHSIHNVAIEGSIAVCAWYVDGAMVLDLEDPSRPELIGWYDSYEGSDVVEERPDGTEWPNVGGATNVWLGGPYIAISDQQRGLLLFALQD